MAFSHQGIIRCDVVVALGQNCSPFPSQKFVGILSADAGAMLLLYCCAFSSQNNAKTAVAKGGE